MNKQRPINLDLRTVRMPITATASILHRISAVVLWVGLAFSLPALYLSLSSEQDYQRILTLVTDNFIGQFISWGLLTALGYYSVATLKHVVQEIGYCEEKESGKQIAAAAIGTGIVLSLISGVWIWL